MHKQERITKMSRLYINIKSRLMKTGIGKVARKLKHYTWYKKKYAWQCVNENWPDATEQEKAALVKDMMHEARKYDVVFDEYVFHRFREKSQEERRAYIPILEGAGYCERLNQPKNQIIFDDKGRTYEKFRKYYHRDLTEVLGWTDKEKADFQAFVEKHPRFIIKPFSGANGVGIRIVDLSEEGPFDRLCKALRTEFKSGFVAEELIVQAKELSAVNASSVNTMRVITIRMDDRVAIFPSVWRVGQGGNCVDNGGSGGIFCLLDDNGVVVSTRDEKGRSYTEHPDSKIPLIGFQVPRYQEARELAKELTTVVPDNRYCGWDLALTENGWILQEANSHGGIVAIQCPLGRGLRKEMDAIMKELGL